MLGFIGNAIEAIIPQGIKALLGKAGKGKATATGIVGTVAGLVMHETAPLIGGVINSENVVEVIMALARIVTAFSLVISAFGFGRKARDAALDVRPSTDA